MEGGGDDGGGGGSSGGGEGDAVMHATHFFWWGVVGGYHRPKMSNLLMATQVEFSGIMDWLVPFWWSAAAWGSKFLPIAQRRAAQCKKTVALPPNGALLVCRGIFYLHRLCLHRCRVK